MTVEELVEWVRTNRAHVSLRYWHATHTVRVEVAIPPRGRTFSECDYLLPGECDEVEQLMAKVVKRRDG